LRALLGGDQPRRQRADCASKEQWEITAEATA